MTDRPDDTGAFGEEMYRQMMPLTWDDENQGWALLIFLGALGSTIQEIDTLAHDNPPWSALMDINRIPDYGLPWFGQFVGVSVDTSLTPARQRQQIRNHIGWQRGTLEAIRSAIRDYLSGTRTIEIVERDTSAYHFSIFTYADETPKTGTYQDVWLAYMQYEEPYEQFRTYNQFYYFFVGLIDLLALLLAAKPGGLIMNYQVLPGSPGSFKTYQTLWIHNASYKQVWDTKQLYIDVYVNP